MVKSILSERGVRAIRISTLVVLIAAFVGYRMFVLAFVDHSAYGNTLDHWEVGWYLLLCLFLIIFLTRNIFRAARSVEIDTDKRTIRFYSYIFRNTRVESFDSFQGRLSTTLVSRRTQAEYPAVFLLIDGKAKRFFSAYYFANLGELKKAMEAIPDLGFEDDSVKLVRRALFGLPVIDESPRA